MLTTHLEVKPSGGGDKAAPISHHRLPPISSLLAGLDHHDEGKVSSTYGSLPNPHTFSNWDNSSPFGSPSSYGPTSTHLPPYGSGKSTRLASLAPISTSDIHQQHHTSSVRLSPEPQPAGMHHHQARRLPSMQLVSPTGGPLHPLPSGLVGFPPLASPQSLDRVSHPPSPAFRPRSNSVTTHPYAGPYFSAGRNERSNSINGERRTSVGWHSHETSNTRKRRQEAPEPAADRYSRPRTASLSSTEESRPVSAWAAGPDRLGLPGRGGGGSGSTHSSPVESQGPYRGSFDSLGGARRGSGDSGRSYAERSDTSPRMRGHPTAEYHRPASQLAPDFASLHITSAEAWRNIAAPAPFPGSRAPSSIHAPAATPVAAASHPPPRAPWPSGAAALASAAAAAQAHAAQPSGVDDAGESAAEAGRYKCPHCPKRFARPSSLKTHILSHTGEKPFECEICHRGFSVQSNLRRHQKIHENATPANGGEPAGWKMRVPTGAVAGGVGSSDDDQEMTEPGGSRSD